MLVLHRHSKFTMQTWFIFCAISFFFLWEQLDASPSLFLPKLATNNNYSDDTFRKFVVDQLKAILDFKGYSTIDSEVFILWAETCKLPENSFLCVGNNPDSPYAVYMVPPLEGERPGPFAHRLRKDEAIVQIGVTPPTSKYFGMVEYLNNVQRDNKSLDGDTRNHIQASLSDPINPSNINVTSNGTYNDAFDKNFVMITTADKTIFDEIKSALISVGVPDEIINLQVLPSNRLSMGLKEENDVINSIFRMAFFNNETEGNAYLRDIPLSVFRLTPRIEQESIVQLPSPIRAPRINITDQSHFKKGLSRLGREIRKTIAGDEFVESNSFAFDWDADNCIEKERKCFFENADSAYFGNVPGRYFPESAYYVIYGVNDVMTGDARYSSVTLYDAKTFTAAASMTSESKMKGSAKQFLPGYENNDLYYAVWFRRDCQGKVFCVEVPVENGVDHRTTLLFTSRSYMQPNSTKGPDPKLLLPFRVMYGEDPKLLRSKERKKIFKPSNLTSSAEITWPLP